MRLIILLFSAFILFGCSSVKVPSNQKKAEKRVARNIRQNQAILAAYPNLGQKFIDSQRVVVEVPKIEKSLDLKILDPTPIELILQPYISDTVILTKVVKELIKLTDTVYTESNEEYSLTVSILDGNLKVNMDVFPRFIETKIPVEKIIISDKRFYEFIEFWITVLILVAIITKYHYDNRAARSINSS